MIHTFVKNPFLIIAIAWVALINMVSNTIEIFIETTRTREWKDGASVLLTILFGGIIAMMIAITLLGKLSYPLWRAILFVASCTCLGLVVIRSLVRHQMSK